MSNEKSSIQDFLDRLREDFKNNSLPDKTIFMSSRDKINYERTGREMFGFDAENDDATPSTLHSVKIHYSPHIETGTVYIVDNKPVQPFRTRLQIEDTATSFLTSFYTRSFTIPSIFMEPYHWQRHEGESVIEWGNRLSIRNLLDDHEIRWEYQKAVAKSILSAPKRILELYRKVKAAYLDA